MRRAVRRLLPSPGHPNERGQALVEFAIVAPLVVMVLLFGIWFYELIFVRLKAQEAARYAAWEATAYKQHDYKKGSSALGSLASTMQTQIMTDTMVRYSDLNSSKNSVTGIGLQHTILAASWVQPVVLLTNASEEQVPGGWIANTAYSLALSIYDWLSALNYTNDNTYARTLIAAGKNKGGAMKHRLTGNSDWGFNSRGYVEARVGVMVTNNFFNRGVGQFLVDHNAKSFLIWEHHALLTDPWRLEDGAKVYGGTMSPGVTSTEYGKMMERMYLMSSGGRSTAKGLMTGLWALGNIALNFAGAMASPPIKVDDFTRPVVVSQSFGDNATKGKAKISQDRGSTKEYDTAPATSSEGSKDLKEFGKTLQKRGRYFMGCDKEMSLGCPSSTLSQDNPFGSYISRE